MTWRSIKDDPPPKDGTEFQGWVLNGMNIGFWEPRCRFHPETGGLELWGRIGYDEDGWDSSIHWTLTHWQPQPVSPYA